MDPSILDRRCIDTLRFLAADAVERAGSGHPGTPMGAAAAAYALWDRFLKHNPANPAWPDRDRFVLSAGHACLLLYGLLHLTGYNLSLDELRRFRQWESRTPGHPEHGLTPGVEATTGPLGQGFSMAVGMALTERWLAARFNRSGHEVIDHWTYVLASDGDLQEGVSSEAASLAGTWGLGKLVCLYDANRIQIEGSTDLAFREDVGGRFRAYGWQVLGPVDGLDPDAVAAALGVARGDRERPSLIVSRTIIGYGSPEQGTAKVHGEPLGRKNLLAAKEALGWPAEPTFRVPDEVRAHMAGAVSRGAAAEAEWQARWASYTRAHPELAAELRGRLAGELPEAWEEPLRRLSWPADAPLATRDASGAVLQALAAAVPGLVGGAADLAPSTKTMLAGLGDVSREHPDGRNVHFGVREHALAAIVNGMALHGGCIPYGATFLTFSDYLRPALRLAALMGLRVVYVFTHDSIGMGEDGPTHQPVEHLLSLRAVPNLTVIRPADGAETAEAWRAALLNTGGPTALVLSRQKLPVLDRRVLAPADGLRRGGYCLWESGAGPPEVIVIGTGSEVHLALAAGRQLAARGLSVRVVSLPSWELFDREPRKYRESILPPEVRVRVAVEAGTRLGWEHYVGLDGAVVGLDRFGASAPAEVLAEKLGITAVAVVETAEELLGRRGAGPAAGPEPKTGER
ncbi:MAG: transketolase [Deltaproteobacteria bacterium]|nr:transketolase [Deltaproteobacteria bacterium]